MSKILYLFLLFVMSFMSAQISNDSFSQGFNEGYDSVLEENKLSRYYNYLADKTKCPKKAPYNLSIEKDVDNKLYKDGYRCGVQQAMSHLSKIKESIEHDALKSFEERNKDNVTSQLDEVNKINEQRRLAYEKQQIINNAEQASVRKRKELEQTRKNNLNAEHYRYSMNEARAKMQVSVDQLGQGMEALGTSLMQMQQQRAMHLLQDRYMKEKRFVDSNIAGGNKLINFFKNISPEVFNKEVSGIYKAGIYQSQEFSFSRGKSIQTYLPCLVEVENNKLINIYPYGKRAFSSLFPVEDFRGMPFQNGVLSYSVYETLETVSIIMIEPYVAKIKENHEIIDGGTGKVVVWSRKKDDESREVFIHEREYDKKNKKIGGDIVREVKTNIVYAKRVDDIDLDSVSPVTVNNDSMIMVIGAEVRTLPQIGEITLFPKVSNSSTKPLGDEKIRYIEIKNYR